GGRVTIRLGAYDHHRALVLDPTVTLAYSTYLGGSVEGDGAGIAVDSSGDAYVTGFTISSDFPTHDPLQRKLGGRGYPPFADAFVAKLNPAGSALLYSTYLGGSGGDAGVGIAVDTAGDAYVTGNTTSSDFPTHDPLQPKFAGANGTSGAGNAFVAKLNPAGSALLYSTYLGGSGGGDVGQGIAVDSAGDAYVTGFTFSLDFPTHDPLQPKNGGAGGGVNGGTAFVAKLNPAGSALLYSTYLGGRGDDSGQGIAVDTAGDAYVTGFTFSLDFPTHDPLQPKNGAAGGGVNGGTAFVAKLNPAGSALLYSTYLGGSDDDSGQGIALDTAGDAYVTGNTSSPDFPTHNPLQPKLPGIENPFVAKLGPVVADGSARLHLRRFHLSPARLGCKVESYRRAHASSVNGSEVTSPTRAHASDLEDSSCTLALLSIAGTIDRRADGQQLTITLRAKLGHRSVLIITHPRISNGRWRLRVRLPGRGHEPGDRWRFTIAYPGANGLRPAAITGGFLLEAEVANNSPV
ncbi:MAG: SBBP repeat-containing protein, partial [Actinomycetota bacterium]|nr:SBBP repeat-containing protein [Actinomycetota bacterium]